MNRTNKGFISDTEIDRILGKITQRPANSSNPRPAIDTSEISVEKKAELRGIYNQKKAQEFASVYSDGSKLNSKAGLSFFNNKGISAGLVRRVYAFLTDICIVGLVMVAIVYGAFYFFETFSVSSIYGVSKVSWLLLGLYIFLFLSYMLYFEALCGQSLGKMFLNVKIVDKTNKRPDFLTTMVRMIFFIIPPLGLFGFHNMLTGTRLVMND